ncbi:MAG: sulfatase-like hydrolase/transferase, partial [SAR324 cluster bacterium]|nr:sulfatase-like hydrolase/transferase [SAR324 cluster bacterium]
SNSYWFKNATSVNQFTRIAVPAIVSGIFPTSTTKPPVYLAHPNNLFTLLAPKYDMEVYEPYTKLCPGRICAKGARSASFRAKQNAIDKMTLRKRKDWSTSPVSTEDRAFAFKRYLRAMRAHKRPALYFMHNILPHMPFQFMPSLRAYRPHTVRGYMNNHWSSEQESINVAYRQYLLQTGAADTMLGLLINKLKSIGVYDRALIIVMSDHGLSFQPGDYRRSKPSRANFVEDILYIPLFIKLPYQQGGTVDFRNIESIDVLPTIAEITNIPITWNADGASIFSSGSIDRIDKAVFINQNDGNHNVVAARSGSREGGALFSFPAPSLPPRETLEWKLSLPGYSYPNLADPFYIGPHSDYIGRSTWSISDLSSAPFTFNLDKDLKLDTDRKSLIFEEKSGTCPCRIVGFVSNPPGTTLPSRQIAVSINGILWGFANLFDMNGDTTKKSFDLTVSDRAFLEGRNKVEIYFSQINDLGELSLSRLSQKPSRK